MSQRMSTIASEESAPTPGSPLRRSIRIANSPAPAAAPTAAAPLTRRRSSATDTSTSTPAKLTRTKRSSLSHEIVMEDAASQDGRLSRSSNKSPSTEVEAEAKPATRRRAGSMSKLVEEEAARPPTPGRRRSVRAASTSPTRKAEEAAATAVSTPKPRGRRPSLSTQTSLEAINEVVPPPKPVGRQTRTSRRASLDCDDSNPPLDDKKSSGRRSMQALPSAVGKPVLDLNPITEEQENADAADNDVSEKKKSDVSEVVELMAVEETPMDVDESESSESFPMAEKTDIPEKDKNAATESELHITEKQDMSSALTKDSEVATVQKEKDDSLKDAPLVKTEDILVKISNDIKTDDSATKDSICEEISTTPLIVEEGEAVKPETSPIKLAKDEKFKSPTRRSPRTSSPACPISSCSPRIAVECKKQIDFVVAVTNDLNQFTTAKSPTKEPPSSPRRSPRIMNIVESSPEKNTKFSTTSSDVELSPLQVCDETVLQLEKSTSSPAGKVLDTLKAATNLRKDIEQKSVAERKPRKISSNFTDVVVRIEPIKVLAVNVDDNSEQPNKKPEVAYETDVLNCSGSSSSDKENANKSPTKSPKLKKSLSLASTPQEVPAKLNETINEVDNQNEFGSSPIKAMKKVEKPDIDALLDSFVDEVVDSDEENTTPAEKKVEGTENEKESDKIVDLTDEDVVHDSMNEEKTVEVSDPPKDVNIPEIHNGPFDNKGSKRIKMEIPARLDALVDSLIAKKAEEEEEESSERSDSPKEVNMPEIQNGLSDNKVCKPGKIPMPTQKKAEELDTSSSDQEGDDEFDFFDMEAEEIDEESPYDDSNDIIDEGESLHSSDSAEECESEEYENDSFVASDESVELLSGNEYDLEDMEKPMEKKRRSRIIPNLDSSDDNEVAVETDKANTSEKKDAKKIVVLQDIKLTSPIPTVGLVETHDKVASPASPSLKKSVSLEEPTEEVAQNSKLARAESLQQLPDSQNTSINDSITGTRKSRKKSSLTIQEKIKVSEISKTDISDKIEKALQYFVSSIEDKSAGNVSLNMSLDYANNSSEDSSLPPSPKKQKKQRASLLLPHVNNINQAVEEILQTSSQQLSTSKSSSVQDGFEIVAEPGTLPSMSNKHLPKSSVSPTLKQKKRKSINKSVTETAIAKTEMQPTPKTLELKHSSPTKAKKRSISAEDILTAGDAMVSPKKKSKSSEQVQAKPEQRKRKANEIADDLPTIDHHTGMQIATEKNARVTRNVAPESIKDIQVATQKNARVSRSEATGGAIPKHGNKKWKPSTTGHLQVDEWQLQACIGKNYPSRKNKDEIVRQELNQVRNRIAPNDFRNKMIYDSRAARTGSKDIMKNKKQSSYKARKQ